MLFPVPRGQGGKAAQKGLSGLLLADNFRFCPLVLQEEEELAFQREGHGKLWSTAGQAEAQSMLLESMGSQSRNG